MTEATNTGEAPPWSYSQRLRIWETGYGRYADWIVERHGESTALLTDPKPADMFWTSYKITPTTTDENTLRELSSQSFWDQSGPEGITCRSSEFGVLVQPFAQQLLPDSGRIALRGVFLLIDHPRWYDRVILWLRQRLGIAASR